MSSIGGINSSSLDITTLLKRLSNQQTSEDNTTVSGLGTLGGSSRMQNKFAEALTALGVSDDEVTSIQDDIKSAISKAMKNADSTTDVKATIQDAVDQTLKDHGVDEDKLKSQLKSSMGGAPPMGGMPPGQGGMPPGMTDALKETGLSDDEISSIQDDIQTALDKLKTSSTSSTSSTDTKDVFRSTIDQVLKDHGVDTEKLQSLMGPPPDAAGATSSTSSTSGTQSSIGKSLLAQLGYSSNTDNSSDQLLLSLMPLMDEQV